MSGKEQIKQRLLRIDDEVQKRIRQAEDRADYLSGFDDDFIDLYFAVRECGNNHATAVATTIEMTKTFSGRHIRDDLYLRLRQAGDDNVAALRNLEGHTDNISRNDYVRLREVGESDEEARAIIRENQSREYSQISRFSEEGKFYWQLRELGDSHERAVKIVSGLEDVDEDYRSLYLELRKVGDSHEQVVSNVDDLLNRVSGHATLSNSETA